jgi:hypothetical protein
MSVEVLEKRLARIEAKLLGKKLSCIAWGDTREEAEAMARKLRGRVTVVYIVVAAPIEKDPLSGTYRGDLEPRQDDSPPGSFENDPARREDSDCKKRQDEPQPAVELKPEPCVVAPKEPEEPPRKSLAGRYHPRRHLAGAKFEPFSHGKEG